MRRQNIISILFIFVLILCCNDNFGIQDTNRYDYLLYLPKSYSEDSLKNWPLIIFLHGASLRGNDLEKIKKFGIPNLIEQGKKFPFLIISPQLPTKKRWSTDNWLDTLFVEVTVKYRIDPDRIYLTGLSLGGEGTWHIAEKYSDKFAAIAPICGRTSYIPDIREEVNKIKHLPIWVFHGAKDRVIPIEESETMVKLLRKYNSNVKFTVYQDLGHGETHKKAYNDEELYIWFLSKNRKNNLFIKP
ncbi:prolyl oligopeptidase family serine peptidase [Bacteroidota bacterium]